MLRKNSSIRSPSSRMGVSGQCKLAVLGAGAVGKTSLVRRFLHNQFNLNETETVGDSFSGHVMFPNGLTRQVQIADTAGSLDFPAERHVVIQAHSAFLLVCQAGSVASINAAAALLADISRLKGADQAARVTVCINKSDQGSTDNFLECCSLAEKLLSVKPIVASAKTCSNVLEVFYMALWPESMRGTSSSRLRLHPTLRRIVSSDAVCRSSRKIVRKRMSLMAGSKSVF